LLQSLLVLPMFLPPVAVGLLLLLLLGPSGPFSSVDLLFTPFAAVLAASVVSFPLMLRHCQEAFSAVPLRLVQVSQSLGASRFETFRRIELPLARRGLAVGLLLAFARGISEYGATSVIAGVMPGRTETLATGLMRRLSTGDDSGALMLALISIVLGFVAVLLSEVLLKKSEVAS
jgi:molybdate transport system permease protein